MNNIFGENDCIEGIDQICTNCGTRFVSDYKGPCSLCDHPLMSMIDCLILHEGGVFFMLREF